MRPDLEVVDDPDDRRESLRMEFLRGAIYGYRVGREQGFGEGVKAMHEAVVKVLKDRREEKANGTTGRHES